MRIYTYIKIDKILRLKPILEYSKMEEKNPFKFGCKHLNGYNGSSFKSCPQLEA